MSQNTVIVHVPKALVVDAGANSAITQNQQVILGGSPTAQFGFPPYQYNWSPATGLNDPTWSNPFAAPGDTTTYSVEVTDANGCTQSDQVTVNVTSIGIDELSVQSELSIFPNPNTGKLTIDFHQLKGKAKVSIVDISGKHIIEKHIDLNVSSVCFFDLKDYPSGQYLLSVSGDSFTITRSLIKK